MKPLMFRFPALGRHPLIPSNYRNISPEEGIGNTIASHMGLINQSEATRSHPKQRDLTSVICERSDEDVIQMVRIREVKDGIARLRSAEGLQPHREHKSGKDGKNQGCNCRREGNLGCAPQNQHSYKDTGNCEQVENRAIPNPKSALYSSS